MNPQRTRPTCDACGDLFILEREDFRILEVPAHAIDDIRSIDPDIADELLANDGRLAYHAECEHPIHQYLPERSEPVCVADLEGERESPANVVTACPVCNIPVSRLSERCGRCGARVDHDRSEVR